MRTARGITNGIYQTLSPIIITAELRGCLQGMEAQVINDKPVASETDAQIFSFEIKPTDSFNIENSDIKKVELCLGYE